MKISNVEPREVSVLPSRLYIKFKRRKTMKDLFDLQLFAGQLNTNVTTDGSQPSDTHTVQPTMKTFYKTSLLENARNEHYFNQFGQKQPLPKNGGKKVEWRKFDTYSEKSASPLTEGVTPDGNSVNMTKIEQEIAQYGDYTTISDRLELEAVDPIITAVTEEHGAQAGDTLDIVTRNEVVSGSNVMFAGGKTRATMTAADVLTTTLIDQAVTMLKKQHAPTINGDYIAIIHPSVAYDLRESTAWLDVHKYAQPSEIYNGEIGKLHGVRFIEDSLAKIWKGGADGKVAVYATMVFGKDAYGIIEPSAESLEVIIKQRGSAGTNDPLDQRSTVGWKASHAAKILYEERMVRIESGSFFSAKDEEN